MDGTMVMAEVEGMTGVGGMVEGEAVTVVEVMTAGVMVVGERLTVAGIVTEIRDSNI